VKVKDHFDSAQCSCETQNVKVISLQPTDNGKQKTKNRKQKNRQRKTKNKKQKNKKRKTDNRKQSKATNKKPKPSKAPTSKF
jgi:hypothetical protein